MSQNELHDKLLAAAEQLDARYVHISMLDSVAALLREAASRIESAQAVAAGGGDMQLQARIAGELIAARDTEDGCNRIMALLAAAPASEAVNRDELPASMYGLVTKPAASSAADGRGPSHKQPWHESQDAEQEQAGELPELPEPKFCDPGIDTGEVTALYTAEQMREHAREYAELVLEAALLRRAARVEVDDAMVERALQASYSSNWNDDRAAMRAALVAALEPKG